MDDKASESISETNLLSMFGDKRWYLARDFTEVMQVAEVIAAVVEAGSGSEEAMLLSSKTASEIEANVSGDFSVISSPQLRETIRERRVKSKRQGLSQRLEVAVDKEEDEDYYCENEVEDEVEVNAGNVDESNHSMRAILSTANDFVSHAKEGVINLLASLSGLDLIMRPVQQAYLTDGDDSDRSDDDDSDGDGDGDVKDENKDEGVGERDIVKTSKDDSYDGCTDTESKIEIDIDIGTPQQGGTRNSAKAEEAAAMKQRTTQQPPNVKSATAKGVATEKTTTASTATSATSTATAATTAATTASCTAGTKSASAAVDEGEEKGDAKGLRRRKKEITTQAS
jgi:hypothetical protein